RAASASTVSLPDALPILIERLGRQRLLQARLPGLHRHELDLRAGEVDRGGYAQQVLALRAHLRGVDERHLTDQHLVHRRRAGPVDRKSTRLNSSHVKNSY